jgi:hypothetical protein
MAHKYNHQIKFDLDTGGVPMKRFIYLTLIIASLCFLFHSQSSLAASAEKPSSKVKKTLNPEAVKSGRIIAKPDLTVTKFNVFPSSPKYMEPITMYMWVKNIGAGDANNSFEIKLYFVKDGNIHPVSFKVLDMGLGAGKEYMLQGSFVPKSSTSYKLVAMADVKDDVAELNEGNNFKEKNITIAQEQKPDLIVSRINMSPQKPKTNEGITYWVFVKNIGQGNSKPCMLSSSTANYGSPPYNFDAHGWSSRLVPALNPGQEWRYTGDGSAGWPQPGLITIRYFIDKENALPETNENNNILDITYEVFE